jgi:hypothetical protein
MTQFQSSFNETLPFSDTCAQIALATNVAQTYTIPGTNKYQMTLSYICTANVFVGYNVSASVPAPNAINTNPNVEFRPVDKKFVKGGDVISFITPDASAYVGVSLLTIPG